MAEMIGTCATLRENLGNCVRILVMLRFHGEPKDSWPTWESHRPELWRILSAAMPFDSGAYVIDRSIYATVDSAEAGGFEVRLDRLAAEYEFTRDRQATVFLFPTESRTQAIQKFKRLKLPFTWTRHEGMAELLPLAPLIVGMNDGSTPDMADPYVYMRAEFAPHFIESLRESCLELRIEHRECFGNREVLSFLREYGGLH